MRQKTPEQRVRVKIGLILAVVIVYFSGLSIYSNSLRKNMNQQKNEMDHSYDVLSKSNQLILSIQQAQDILNLYLVTPQRKFQQQYDSLSMNIVRQIQEINTLKPEYEQNVLLTDIDSLLREKNRIVRRLTGLFRSKNPLTELDRKIESYDKMVRDSVVITTNVDTMRVEKPGKKNFWSRLRNVFDPDHAPDTTFNITHTEKEAHTSARIDTLLYSDLKNITDEASKSYSTRIEGIEKEVRELVFAEQSISLHISQLTNEFYNETIGVAWMGTEQSESLSQRIFDFALLSGGASILIILIITLLIASDLNKGQKARKDLAREKRFTEELMESRHKLLLSISHDIKTPLTSIMGYLQMWESEETAHEKSRQLDSALSSGNHILNMLTNLLEFSRIQQKSGRIRLSHFNLINLIDEIIGMFHPLTEEKSLSLEFINEAGAPLYVKTDKMLLRQIISNIVSNAVKYTLRGGITIRLLMKGNQAFFTVTDSGIGMDSKELPEIFKPFSRVQNPMDVEGSGLGLYVTKGLIDLLQGSVQISSMKGNGTEVTFAVPVSDISRQPATEDGGRQTTPVKPAAKPNNDPQTKKVLIFEDNVSLGKMICEYMVRKGQRVKLCSNPEDVNGFLQVIHQFDLVLTDMQMSGMTGLDILKGIRNKGCAIPVWLMTANDDYTAENADQDGFSGLIRKPIRMKELMGIISPQKSPLVKMFPQLAALFGDDEDAIRDILTEFASSTGPDAEQLLELIEKGEFKEAQSLCHKMYPFLAQLGVEQSYGAMRKMDQCRDKDESAYSTWKEELAEEAKLLRQLAETVLQELQKSI